MFAYCNNNPVNFVDHCGTVPTWAEAKTGVANCFSAPEEVFGNILASVQGKTGNYRPPTGEPGSTYRAPNGDSRTYGPDGKPSQDYDHSDHGNPKNHPHDENGGHYHDWENGQRGGPYVPLSFNLKKIGIMILTFACVAAATYVVLNDATVIGCVDDFLLPPLVTMAGKGAEMLLA